MLDPEKFLSWPLISLKDNRPLGANWEAVSAKLHEHPIEIDKYDGIVFGWLGLAQLVERYEGGLWFFRGQSKGWPLLPHLSREGVRKSMDGNSREFLPEEERTSLLRFKARGVPHLSFEPESDLEWLAIARHHDMPTRLLDWSESIFAAVMFACQPSGWVGEKLTHAELSVISEIPEMRCDNPFEIEDVRLYRPRHVTPRITAQQGVFTIHPMPRHPLDNHRKLERWLIWSESSFYIKKKLHLCGINEYTLFPDLGGLGRLSAWTYKWGLDWH